MLFDGGYVVVVVVGVVAYVVDGVVPVVKVLLLYEQLLMIPSS